MSGSSSTLIPDLTTDARPPLEHSEAKLIVLAGAIKWWWLSQCTACSEIGDRELGFADEICPYGHEFSDTHGPCLEDFFGSPRHQRYIRWRNDVRKALIDAGYLTYAPHEAFKGVWNPAAQVINDAAIIESNAMLVLSPPEAITEGTDDEVEFAGSVNTPVVYAPPDTRLEDLISGLDKLLA